MSSEALGKVARRIGQLEEGNERLLEENKMLKEAVEHAYVKINELGTYDPGDDIIPPTHSVLDKKAYGELFEDDDSAWETLRKALIAVGLRTEDDIY